MSFSKLSYKIDKTLKEAESVWAEQTPDDLARIVKLLYKKDLLSKVTLGHQGIGRGKGEALGAEVLYDWRVCKDYAHLPGVVPFLVGKLHLGSLMKKDGLGEIAESTLARHQEETNHTEEWKKTQAMVPMLKQILMDYNLVGWQKKCIADNARNASAAEKELFELGWVTAEQISQERFGTVTAAEIKLAEIYNSLCFGWSTWQQVLQLPLPDGVDKPYVASNTSRAEILALFPAIEKLVVDWYRDFAKGKAETTKEVFDVLVFTLVFELLEIISAAAVVKAGKWDQYIGYLSSGFSAGMRFAVDDCVTESVYNTTKELSDSAVYIGATDTARAEEAVREEKKYVTIYKMDVHAICAVLGFNHNPRVAVEDNAKEYNEFMKGSAWRTSAPGEGIEYAPQLTRGKVMEEVLTDIKSYENLKTVVGEGSFHVCKNQDMFLAIQETIMAAKNVKFVGQGNETQDKKFSTGSFAVAMRKLATKECTDDVHAVAKKQRAA